MRILIGPTLSMPTTTRTIPSRPPRGTRAGRWTRVVGLTGLVGLLGLTAACGREPTDPPPLAGGDVFFAALTLNHHAVTLAVEAPYDTAQLVATPVNALGTRPPGVGAVTYTTSSPSVTVSPTGLVTARAVEQGVLVVASAYDSLLHVTRSDTAVVNVTAAATPVASLSIQPPAGDSARAAAFGDPCTNQGRTLTPRVRDAGGQEVPGVAVAFTSSDTATARVSPSGTLTGKRVGPLTFTATAYAYGRALRDTLPYTIGYPLAKLIVITQRTPTASLEPVNYFGGSASNPPIDTIGVGGLVVWMNQWPQPMDVAFDTPSAALATGFCGFIPETGAGSIPAWRGDEGAPTYGSRVRQFVTPGTYAYHSTVNPSRYPTSGRIVVVGRP